MSSPPKPPSSLRDFRETVRNRADWETPSAGAFRWLVFFACLAAGPVLLPHLSSTAGVRFLVGVLAFWIWWSLPFIGYRRSLLNLPLVLVVIAANVTAWMVVANRTALR